MHFVKMHGIANDYVYIDAFTVPEVESHFGHEHGHRLVRQMSHRHTGIGSDGVILVCRPSAGADAHVRMRMFNSDGSESEMCGNGVRCVAKFAHDRLGVRAQPMLVETGRGVLSIDYAVEEGKLVGATVDMGEPILELARIPVDPARLAWSHEHTHGVETPAGCWACVFVSMGNPHAVIFEQGSRELTGDRLRDLELFRVGPIIETHPAFPRRVNVHVVAVHSPGEATMRTWERGAGLTQACGTGACAVLVAGVLTERLARRALLHLPGGDLMIHWEALTNHVLMTGPAEDVFEGEWPDY
jgi:diaminopimelate epimerase